MPSISIKWSIFFLYAAWGYRINIFEQGKRFNNRDIPPELRPLTEYGADIPCILHSLLIRIDPVYFDITGGGHRKCRSAF